MKIYRKIDTIPTGRAGEDITTGALVLERGGWKGLYTLGVLDAMMQENMNFSSVVGVSAGALSALGYVAGQIGWGARIDLTYRHDRNYVGIGALRRDHGITGFSYLFEDILKDLPLDEKRLYAANRRLAVSATNLQTGQVEYFEKGQCVLYRAVRASASVPYVTKPVMIDGTPYLDGGCAEKIPYAWGKECGEKKIIVVRTRELSYRRKPGTTKLTREIYRKYPAFVQSMEKTNERFNETVEALQADALAGRVFVIAPSKLVTVKRFDGDMEKLGNLYWLGYQDMRNQVQALRAYEQYNEKSVSIGGEVVSAKKTYADSCWLYNFPKDETAHELSFDLIAVRESDISSYDLSVWYTYHIDDALGYAENVIVPVP